MAEDAPDRDVLRIDPFGDAALLVTVAGPPEPGPDPVAWMAARAAVIAHDLGKRWPEPDRIGRAVPAVSTVLVPFDPLAIEAAEAIALVRDAATAALASFTIEGPAAAPERVVEIPVRYGGADGPDLQEIADARGLRPSEVIALHAGTRYRVLFLGFAPGFAYLGGLPRELVSPRRASPRERVPAGSVAIAGEQTGVYPLAMPGGWNLIGRTERHLFDASAADPALLHPGDTVRFVPVG